MDWWVGYWGFVPDGDDGFPDGSNFFGGKPIVQQVQENSDTDEMPPLTTNQLKAAIDVALDVRNKELFMHYSAELNRRLMGL